MKKILIVAAVIFTSGALSLYINNKPSQSTSTSIKVIFYDYKKELGSGD